MSSGADAEFGRQFVLPLDLSALTASRRRFLQETLRLFLKLKESLPADITPLYAQTAAAAGRLWARDPDALLTCLESAAVAVPLHCHDRRRLWPALRPKLEASVAECIPHLLLEMSRRRRLPAGASLIWKHPIPLLCPELSLRLTPPTGAAALVFLNGSLEALAADGRPLARLALDGACTNSEATSFRVERVYRPLSGPINLALCDPNPISAIDEHPDKEGNALSLGGRPLEEWTRALSEAFALIRGIWPELYAEMEALLRAVVPVGYDAEKHLSASYAEALGVIYLTLHPKVLTLAEALIHEFQHNKANLAAQHAPLLENAFSPLYTSPVRPDPRPLWGVLLAVHAFLPVAEFHRKLRRAEHPLSRTPEFDAHLSDIDRKNRQGMDVLRAHAKPTPLGRGLIRELSVLERRHAQEQAGAAGPASR